MQSGKSPVNPVAGQDLRLLNKEVAMNQITAGVLEDLEKKQLELSGRIIKNTLLKLTELLKKIRQSRGKFEEVIQSLNNPIKP